MAETAQTYLQLSQIEANIENLKPNLRRVGSLIQFEPDEAFQALLKLIKIGEHNSEAST